MEKLSKSGLAIALSRLKTFEDADHEKEQYATDSEIAAEILWNAFMANDLQEKEIADLGCGTGILGIGALLLGAKMVYFVDIDGKALDILRENLDSIEKETGKFANFEIRQESMIQFSKKVDLVLQNPPFGTRVKHADREFLEHAFKMADRVYSFHKTETRDFITDFSRQKGFSITNYFEFSFPLKQTMNFHDKRLYRINVCCFRLEKQVIAE
jgi:putative methylase